MTEIKTTFTIHPLLDYLADSSRRSILENLRTGSKSVMFLVKATGLKQPNVSNHLAKMREQGVVSSHRDGRNVFYRLSSPRVEEMLNAAFDSVTCEYEPVQRGDIEQWAKRYRNAMLELDEEKASAVVGECLTRHAPLADIYVDIMQPALFAVGYAYVAGHITEAEEHLATNITERLMAWAAHFYHPASANGYRAILGAVAGNRHSIGLQMIADLLHQSGWKTYMLGANVPASSFVHMIKQVHANLAIISCAQEEMEQELISIVQRIHSCIHRVKNPLKIFIGGGYVNMHPEIVERVEADGTALDARSLLFEIDLLYPSKGE